MAAYHEGITIQDKDGSYRVVFDNAFLHSENMMFAVKILFFGTIPKKRSQKEYHNLIASIILNMLIINLF